MKTFTSLALAASLIVLLGVAQGSYTYVCGRDDCSAYRQTFTYQGSPIVRYCPGNKNHTLNRTN